MLSIQVKDRDNNGPDPFGLESGSGVLQQILAGNGAWRTGSATLAPTVLSRICSRHAHAK
jgi:hypothetical protein